MLRCHKIREKDNHYLSTTRDLHDLANNKSSKMIKSLNNVFISKPRSFPKYNSLLYFPFLKFTL